MAQAVEQHTLIKDLDDLLRYLTEDLGYSKGVAIYSMNQRYHGELDGRLHLEKQDLIRDDEPYGGWVATNAKLWDLKLDRDGHVQVIPRIKLWRKARYRIAEGCDVRAIWPPHPPAPQPAPDQQPEDKVGPDPTSDPAKPASTQEWVTAEAIQRKKDNNIPANARVHISHFAQLLEKAEANKSSPHPVGWRHIKNMLPTWGLWPIESIKIS